MKNYYLPPFNATLKLVSELIVTEAVPKVNSEFSEVSTSAPSANSTIVEFSKNRGTKLVNIKVISFKLNQVQFFQGTENISLED